MFFIASVRERMNLEVALYFLLQFITYFIKKNITCKIPVKLTSFSELWNHLLDHAKFCGTDRRKVGGVGEEDAPTVPKVAVET